MKVAFSIKPVLGFLLLPATIFLFALSGGVQYLGKQATLFFKHYTDAELKKLEASGFINEDGKAEYVVGLDPDQLALEGAAFLNAFDGVEAVRPTGFSNWYVVATAVGSRDVADAIRAAPQSRFVLHNRGLWICH